MKSKLTCLILVLLLTLKSFSQQQETETEVTNVIKATILNPGIAYEAKLGKYQTAYAQLFINTSGNSWDDAYGQVHIDFYIDPAATLQFRHYYNARRREEYEKRTEMNSMNYIALVGETFFSKIPLGESPIPEEKRRAVNQVGLCWGLQRNFNSRFSLDLYFGPGFRFANYMTHNRYFESERVRIREAVLMGQFNIGFWLNKRSRVD